MQIKEINSKSITVPSKLPSVDYVINPYTGCMHSCKYCYASFMTKFRKDNQSWGEFVDIKINCLNLLDKEINRLIGKRVLISSVTDPYQPLEQKYMLTRAILNRLSEIDVELIIITKSDLVLRDIDILQKFKKLKVAISLSLLNDNIRKTIEPHASSVSARINALQALNSNNIYTIHFISPIWPLLTDWKSLIQTTKTVTDEYWLETLNLYPAIKDNVYNILDSINSNYKVKYSELYNSKYKGEYWLNLRKDINSFLKELRINNYKIFMHN